MSKKANLSEVKEETVFRFIYPFDYDKNRLKNLDSKQFREITDNFLDIEFLKYIKSSYNVQHLRQSVQKHIFLDIKKQKYIFLNDLDFYFFDKKAFCVFNYKKAKIKDEDIVYFASELGKLKEEKDIFLEQEKNITIDKSWNYDKKYESIDACNIKLYDTDGKVTISHSSSKSHFLCEDLSKAERKLGCSIDFSSTVKKFKYLQELVEFFIKPFVQHRDDSIIEKESLYLNILLNYACENDYTFGNILRRARKNESKTYQYTPIEYADISIHANQKTSIINSKKEFKNFFDRYTKKYFYIYLISLYQHIRAEEIIQKSILKLNQEKYEKVKEIKREIIYFLSNTNFSKIINDEYGSIVYEYYRKVLRIDKITSEIKENIALVSTFLEQLEANEQQEIEKNKEKYLKYISYFTGTLATVLTFLELYDRIKN